MQDIIKESALTGVATLASAMLLQKLYKVTKFYPAKPIFWFFIGFNAQFAVSAYKKYKPSAPMPTGLSGLGESLDDKIAMYKTHIISLKRVILGGSARGKVSARRKLGAAQQGLEKLLRLKRGAA